MPRNWTKIRKSIKDVCLSLGHCDWFITADKRLYHKARALYSNFGVLTNVMYPDEAITAIQNEILPYEHNYINTFFQDELIPDHIVDRHYKEDDADCDYVVYEFSKYFLGFFSHCTHYYNSDDSSTLQFKLVFGNYSRFLFYDETSIMLDTLTQIFGLQGIADYDKTREKIMHNSCAGDNKHGFVCHLFYWSFFVVIRLKILQITKKNIYLP